MSNAEYTVRERKRGNKFLKDIQNYYRDAKYVRDGIIVKNYIRKLLYLLRKIRFFKKIKFPLLPFVLPLGLFGCDDIKVVAEYAISDLQKHAEEGKYDIGDSIEMKDGMEKLCLVAPRDDLRTFSNIDRKVFYSENFYFIVEKRGGDEVVTIANSEWIATEGNKSICSYGHNNIIVHYINNGRIELSLRDGINGN